MKKELSSTGTRFGRQKERRHWERAYDKALERYRRVRLIGCRRSLWSHDDRDSKVSVCDTCVSYQLLSFLHEICRNFMYI